MARWQPFTSTSISQAAPTDWLCSALKAATQAFGDCRSRPGTGWTISKLEYPPFLSPFTCWGRADFFIQNLRYPASTVPKAESLFFGPQNKVHTSSGMKKAPACFSLTRTIWRVCVSTRGVNLRGLPLLLPSGSNFLF